MINREIEIIAFMEIKFQSQKDLLKMIKSAHSNKRELLKKGLKLDKCTHIILKY